MISEIFARFPAPPVVKLLGWTLLDGDAQKGWVKIAFEGKPEFLNPAGFVQGGILAAMLDDTMGPVVLVMSNGTLYTATIDMNVSFLAPAKPGPLVAEGRVVQMGKTIAFMEAAICDADGVMLARATGSARLVPIEKLSRPN
jgi:uncharacterized protein (TIGR00369 family)